jgi:hypothetical protein
LKTQALLCAALCAGFAQSQNLNCDLSGYKPQDGLKAQVSGDTLDVTWQGERRDQLRASFGIQNGQRAW